MARIPEVPDEPFASGAPYWYWLGGRPALDFVNTRRERWSRDIDCLRSPADLAAWLVDAELLRSPLPATPELLQRARVLREAIDAGVGATLAGAAPDPAALAHIDGWLSHAATRPALLTGRDGQPVLGERGAAESPEAALGAVALDAARMLGLPAERARIRICGSESCSARFYDRSPAGRRRWCSMQACGNVAKARRHRERAVQAIDEGRREP